MNPIFDKAINFVLAHEGGYVNDPADPGGETNYGISKRMYPGVDIKNLTRDLAVEIYYKDYWMKGGCDPIPLASLAILHFDTCINLGLARAANYLQACNGSFDRYMLLRLFAYVDYDRGHAQALKYLFGLMCRCDDLFDTVMRTR